MPMVSLSKLCFSHPLTQVGREPIASTDVALPPAPSVGGIQVSANLGSGNIHLSI